MYEEQTAPLFELCNVPMLRWARKF